MNITESTHKLSYILVTKNKLPFLRDRINVLLAQKQSDEEILVADANSTDGSKEYLAGLKAQGKIDYYISEPDFGESHALNKLLFFCRGTLVTAITDDDVFDFHAIRACKAFMLEHSKIDFLSTEGGSFHRTYESLENRDPLQLVRPLDYEKNYRKWQVDHTPFSFCGLGMMFRLSSLPVLGLFNLSFRAADAEFSFRTTAGKANIAWYTGYSFVNISNPQSVSLVFRDKIKNEVERLNAFYLGKKKEWYIIQKIKVIRTKLRIMWMKKDVNKSHQSKDSFESRWPEIASMAQKWLTIKNEEKKPEFLWNNGNLNDKK